MSAPRPPIGFAFVTHSEPGQLLRLCRRLGEMFHDPPIAIHHDFSQTNFDRDIFPPNVRFVQPWVATGWGVIGVVDALIAAFRLLYQSPDDGWGDPDWAVSLTAADYPIQSAETILRDLASTDVDAFLDHREIDRPGHGYRREVPGGDYPFAQPLYRQVAFRRYMAKPLLTRSMARRLKVDHERFVLTADWVVRHSSPFDGTLRCFSGEGWMTIRRGVARRLLEDSPLWRRLRKHLSGRVAPEEAIYHTLLGNTPGLRLSPDNLRYTDWRGQHAHPRTLGRDDFPALLQSHAHFARKFPDDPALLAALDRAVEQKGTAGGEGNDASGRLAP